MTTAERIIVEQKLKSLGFVLPDVEKNRAHQGSTELLRELLANSPAGLPDGHYLAERYAKARNEAVKHLFRKEL